MKKFVFTFIFLISIPVFGDDRQREIEYEAINIVIQKYGKELSNRLKDTGSRPGRNQQGK